MKASFRDMDRAEADIAFLLDVMLGTAIPYLIEDYNWLHQSLARLGGD